MTRATEPAADRARRRDRGPTRRLLLAGGLGLALAPLARRGGAGATAPARGPAAARDVSLPVGPSGRLRGTYVEVDGRLMRTVVSAAPMPDAPPVVLVHGLALSGRYMLPTAEALAPHYPVYMPDFPGFGDSDKPDRVLDVPGLADALAAWMTAVGLERAALLGNSFGCQIIADLAARHPERVERGVLQGPTSPPDERNWLWQFVRWQQNSPYNPPEMGDVAYDDYAKCGLVRALMTFQFSLDDALEEKLERMPQPMLIVRGEHDPIVPQGWVEFLSARLPRGRMEVLAGPDVSHTLVFTHPDELVAASRPFLDEARRPEGGYCVSSTA